MQADDFPHTEDVVLLFGKALKTQRLKRHMSQEALAEKAGVHRTYIGMLERGEKNVTLTNIKKLATALDIPITELLNHVE